MEVSGLASCPGRFTLMRSLLYHGTGDFWAPVAVWTRWRRNPFFCRRSNPSSSPQSVTTLRLGPWKLHEDRRIYIMKRTTICALCLMLFECFSRSTRWHRYKICMGKWDVLRNGNPRICTDNIVMYEGFARLDLLALLLQLQPIITAHNQWLSQTRSIPYWTTSVFSSAWLTWSWFTSQSLLHLPLSAG
jgi:hypothetical protein